MVAEALELPSPLLNPPVFCTQHKDQFVPFYSTLSTPKSLRAIRESCRVPPEVEFSLSKLFESPESGQKGYFCVYEIFFWGCSLFFPLPNELILFLHHLGLAIPQMAPNMFCYLLCAFTVTAEAGYSLSNSDLFEIFNVHVTKKDSGSFIIYLVADRGLIDGLPRKDDNCWKKWFFIKANPALVSGLADMLHHRWANTDGRYRTWQWSWY